MKETEINNIVSGFFTVNETIGLYHYGLGERIIELLINDVSKELRVQPYPWNELPSKINKKTNLELIEEAIKRYKASLLFFNGMDPLISNENLVEIISSLRKRIPDVNFGSILSCLHNHVNTFSNKIYRILNYTLIFIPDITHIETSIKRKEEYHECLSNALKELISEVHIYIIKEKTIGLITELIENIIVKDAPVHLYNYTSAGINKVREKLREQGITNIYLHTEDGLGIQFTRCPRCGNIVLTRRKGYPTKKILKENKCGYCGTPILYKSPNPNWTNMKVLLGRKEVIPWLIQ